jgi:hypothetical protein
LLTAYVVSVSPWFDVVTFVVLVAVGFRLVVGWCCREGWSARHCVGLASGAALTYAWVGFFNAAELGISIAETMIGSAIFATAGAAVVVHANRRIAVQLVQIARN